MLDRLPGIEQLRLTDLTLPESHPRAGEPCPVFGYLIRHPDGAVLFDTGIGEGHAGIDKLYQPQHHGLVAALDGHGVAPGEVVAVINCHLHFDHAGNNALFPDVPIYVQRAEYGAAQEQLYTVREWIDFPDANYRQLDGEAQVLPGLTLIPTPGHTPGHQSLVIDAAGERVLLAGQACYSADEWSGADEPAGGEWDDEAYAASLARLRALEPARVYFGHDRVVWERD